MRIVFAIKRLESMAGGAERVILQVIDGLRRDYGHDITLITFDRQSAESFYPVPDKLNWIRLGIGNSENPAGIMETVKRIFALRCTVKKMNPDIIIPFQHSMFVPMVLATLGLGKPIIASEHIVPDHYRARPIEYALLILTGLFCKKITVLSQAIIAMYPSILRSRMVAVPNPIQTSDIPADLTGGAQKILLSVGRLDPQKDQKTLIDAFSIISPQFPDWNLKIIGEGRLRPDLEKQIADLSLGGRVTLAGVKKNIMSEYQSAQAFVLASRYEAFGLATAEAMSAGLPVVGFADCAGTNELIRNNENGILVVVENEQSRAEKLADGLKSILIDNALREGLGKRGRADMAILSPRHVVDIWQKLLLSIK